MASTADFRNGFCMDFNSDIWTIVEFLHVKPGKGPAFVRTKLKSLTTGKVVENTFPSGHKVQEVRVERRTYQYLYHDDSGYQFMNNETFDQIAFSDGLIDSPQFLAEGMNVEVLMHAEKEIPLTVELPQHVVLEVTYCEPGVKGDTATNTLKPATLENGATVMVPLFVNTGTKIKVDTRSGTYVERVK
ncbi:MAG: elongation factor P [Chitinophagales bacterium]|jgi:elongation factor P|nr:elongation factor P [Chitinophagales bacterium]HNL07514.1 elongation factor P [Chitinophagales bacterium]